MYVCLDRVVCASLTKTPTQNRKTHQYINDPKDGTAETRKQLVELAEDFRRKANILFAFIRCVFCFVLFCFVLFVFVGAVFAVFAVCRLRWLSVEAFLN
jgi:hypothetical protein